LAKHKVKPTEFEQVMNSNPMDRDYELADDEERFRSIGVTNGGRILSALWTIRNGKIRAITAFNAPLADKKAFLEAIPMKTPLKKKQTTRQAPQRIIVPKFATAGEEAAWWYKNRKAHSEEFLAAARRGEVQILTKTKLLARIEASKKKATAPISIRIPAEDLALARKQAEKKGLPYQTYIKSLLHETLAQRERKAG